ncbi:hypothetical protein BsWGS_09199 [Bradybaena similaris]
MATSGNRERSQLHHAPTPFSSVVTGRKIDADSWLATKSSACTADSRFEKLTNEMKRLSVTRSRRCYLTSLYPAHELPLCAPSPLENAPLTGKKVNIHRKSEQEGMWRPSEAEPGNTACNFLGYWLPRWKPLVRNYPDKTGYQSQKEPVLGNLASEYIRECLTIQGSSSVYEAKECSGITIPCAGDAHKDNGTFYPEPGLAWAVVPNADSQDNGVTCIVSGHQPVRARVREERPILSLFHLFQTELLFERGPSEVSIAVPQPMEFDAFTQKKRPVVWFRKGSDSTDAFCSNISTGHSTVTNCHTQLLDDIQRQSQDVQDDCSARSKLPADVKINSNLSLTCELSEGNHSSIRAATLSFDKDEDEDRITGISLLPEVWILDSECESEAVPILREAQYTKGVLHTLTDVCSENLTDNYTLCDAKGIWEKPHYMDTKLKRPPQTKFSFSKIDVHHIQSEDRKSVMHRLTKLPIRYQKVVRESPHTGLKDSCKHSQSSFTSRFLQPDKNLHISTINLELGVNVAQNKPQLSLPAPNVRKLKSSNTVVNKGALVPGIHFGVQNTLPTWSRTQFVFVGKSVFNGSECKPQNDALISHQTSDARNKASIVTNDIVQRESGQQKINHCETSLETPVTFSSQDKQPAVSSYVGQAKASATTHFSKLNNYEEFTEHVSPRNKQYLSGDTEGCDRQAISINAHDFLGEWSSVVHRRGDGASEIQQSIELSRRRKEDGIPHFSFRCTSNTARSFASLDDVPYNSPAESPCRIMSPVGDLDYINGIVDDHNPVDSRQSDMYHTDIEDGIHGNDFYPEKLDVLRTGVGLKADRNKTKVGPLLHDNVCSETDWTGGDNVLHKIPHLALQDIAKQDHEDDTVVSGLTIDLTHRSNDSVFFDFHEDIQSRKSYAIPKPHKQPNQAFGDTVTQSESVTEVSQLTTQTTCGESSTLQQVSHSTADKPLVPTVTELYMVADRTLLQDYISSDTRDITLTENIAKSKCDVPAQQEPVGPAYKNVRFAEVDNVISYRVPETAVPVRFNPFNGMSALKAAKWTDGLQISSPVLHKQTLQLGTYANTMRRKCRMLRRPESAARSNQRLQDTVQPPCLSDMKWSSHSYRNQYPKSSCMLVRGTSLEVQGDRFKRTEPADSEPLVMYTICPKCEDELHVKFSSHCQEGNDGDVPEVGIGNTCTGEERNADVREAGVGGTPSPANPGCRHRRQDGYCNLCNKIMSWGSSLKNGMVQGQ